MNLKSCKDLIQFILNEKVISNKMIFQPMYRYFKRIASVGIGNYIYFWPSKGFSDKTTAPTTNDYSLDPIKLFWY